MIAVGDKLELEPSFFLGDRWHINQTKYPKNNSPLFARSKQIVMFGALARRGMSRAICGLNLAAFFASFPLNRNALGKLSND
jgi:hypothetical protein